MKPETKKARQNKSIAALLGISPDEVAAMRAKDEADDVMREAQAIFLFLEKPEAFINKKCDECHSFFLTTYQFVSVCSTTCRIKSLEKIGIDWNPLHTPEERWKRAQIPTEYSIPPKALQTLLQLAASQQERDTEKDLASDLNTPSELPELQTNIDQSYNEPLVLPPSEPQSSEDDKSVELLQEFGLDLSL